MALLHTLFGSKKKSLKAACPISREPIEKGFGYLLTTAQVVSSRKYWDLIMTEPETLSYTVSHFRNQSGGTHMRSLIFEKYASIAKPWIISDSAIEFFEVDKNHARESARKWWESDGTFQPDHTGPATEHLDGTAYQQVRDYAILEAGKERVAGA